MAHTHPHAHAQSARTAAASDAAVTVHALPAATGVLGAMPDVAVLLDPNGTVQAVNAAAAAAMGAAAPDLRGRAFAELDCWAGRPNARERIAEAIACAAAGGVTHHRAALTAAAGTTTRMNLRYAPVRDPAGRVTHILAAACGEPDDRTATGPPPWSGEHRLELAITGMDAGVWDVVYHVPPPDERSEVYLSPRLKAFLGYGPDEFPDSVKAWHERILPVDRAEMQRAAREHLEGTRPRYRVEYRIRHRDGSIRWLRSTGLVVRDAGGRPLRWTGVTWDVTAERQAREDAGRRAAQQAAIAELGVLALREPDAHVLLEQAAALVASTLEAPAVGVLEACEGGGAALVAGVGWRPGVLGRTVDASVAEAVHALAAGGGAAGEHAAPAAQVGAALPACEPAATCIAAAVEGHDARSWGWVIACDVSPRRFNRGERMFLQSVAIILGYAKQREAWVQRQRLLLGELSHRVKNTLATVQSIASQTARNAESLEAFITTFEGRLVALARVHGLLTERDWAGVTLHRLVQQVLEPYRHTERGNVCIEGTEDVLLTPSVAMSISMMFHELATNAAKYGALSVDGGRVAVQWSIGGDGAARRLHLAWIECDGPPVQPPTHTGFGRNLIERGLAFQLNASARLDYRPDGVCCIAEIPWSSITSVPAPAPGGR